MRLRLDCIPCIVRQALKAARLSTSDELIQERVLREAMRNLLNVEWVGTPPQLVRAAKISRVILELTGVRDPYKKIKKSSNDEALAMVEEVKSLINSFSDPLEAAVKAAIAGNIIDFAAVETYNLKETLLKVLNQKPAINDYSRLRKELLESDTVLYFLDNSGEVVFDKLLIQEAMELRREPFKRVSFVVKGGPIINDVTLEDALYVGLNKIPNSTFLKVSNGEEGTGPERISPQVNSWIKHHDVTISKGQGNYEDLSEFSGLYFLLIAKCPVVAQDLGVEVGDVIIYYKH